MPQVTRMCDATNLNRRRCLQVGRELIEGPRALFPPEVVDDFGWLEAELRISLWWPSCERIESVAVYSDDTMNRDSGFLPPMLRHSVWHRANDLKGANAWPSVEVKLGVLRSQQAVDNCLRSIQHGVQRLSFPPIGLSVARDVADVTAAPGLPDYAVWVRNGLQSVEYHSCPVANDPFTTQVIDAFSELAAELQDIEKQGWRERYDRNLRSEYPASAWEWAYEA